MALKNPKKRKLSTDSKPGSPKKKKSYTSTVQNILPNAQDSRGCALLTKLIDSGVVEDHEPVFYMRKRDKSVMKEGLLTREGVLCTCCHHYFLLSRFEVHAGSGLHRPSANMFLEDGRSLMQCQQALEVRDAQIKTSKYSKSDHSSSIQSETLQANSSLDHDTNDNICQMCGDGGKLILCDTCPSAFHPDCLGLNQVPDGDWNCPRCCCRACGGAILNAGIQTSASIASPLTYPQSSSKDQFGVTAIISRGGAFLEDYDARIFACPRLEEPEVSTTKKDFSAVSCLHCEASYHFNCVKKNLSHRCNDGPWFCTKDCELVLKRLHNLVGNSFILPRDLSWMIIRSSEEETAAVDPKSVCPSFDRRLLEAHQIMQECFDPVIDTETGVDLLSQTLFSRKAKRRRLNCSGFYVMALMKGDQMVSAATFRVHGQMLAEMPFIATKLEYQHQGMCRTLIKALESTLTDIGVYRLVLPSVDEMLETWMGAFEFRQMTVQERQKVSHISILPFVGTTLLQKSLRSSEMVHEQAVAPETVENKTKPGFIRIKLKLGAARESVTNVEPISCH